MSKQQNRKISTRFGSWNRTVPHVIAMVGMPARGKTYIGTKLARYLRWCGLNTGVFNVGEYRRQATTAYRNHEFFRAENKEALALRTAVADSALNDLLKFLREEGEIAIFDATNTTRERRQRINDLVKENGFKCLFLESVCDNQQLIEVGTFLFQSHFCKTKNNKQ